MNQVYLEPVQKLLNQISFLLLLLLFGVLASVNLSDLFDSTQSGKFIVFVYAITAIATLRLTAILTSPHPPSLRLNILDVSLICLIAYTTINRYLIHPVHGFSFRYYELLGLSVLYVAIRRLDEAACLYLCLALVFSGTMQALYGNMQLHGFYQSFNGNFKITGSFFNPGPYAGYLICVFPVSLYIQLYQDDCLRVISPDRDGLPEADWGRLRHLRITCLKMLVRYLPGLAIITTLLVLPVSHSRAAWLAVAASSLFLLGSKYRLPDHIRVIFHSFFIKAGLVVLTALIVIASIVGLYLIRQDSANGRLLIWKTSLNMIHERPLTGLGYDRWKANYMTYQAAYFRNGLATPDEDLLADNVYYAFNEYLQNATENGLIGLSMVLLILGFCLSARSMGESRFLLMTKAFLISCGVFAFYSYPMQILPIKIALVLMLAMTASSGSFRTLRQLNWPIRSIPRWGLHLAFICLILISVMTFSHIHKIRDALKNWNIAFTIYQGGDYAGSIDHYQKAWPVLRNEGDFMMNYGKALAMAQQHENAIAVLKDAGRQLNTTIVHTTLGDCYKAIAAYTNAEESYRQASYMTPGRFYPKYLLAKLYHETQQDEKAERIARELLLKEAKIESTAVRQMRSEMQKILLKKQKQDL